MITINREWIRNIGNFASNIIFPPTCASCRVAVDASTSLCHDCFAQLQHISAPFCKRCGNPFEYEIDADGLCSDCLHLLPAYDSARAALYYNTISSALVTRFKYADATHLAPYLARMMHGLLHKADMIVPVPLHPKRLRARRYNQSMLLAHHLARHAHLPCSHDMLLRTRHTQPQASLDLPQRQHNVADAFHVTKHKAATVAGKRIILVDDVITTGSTVNACATALHDAGVAHVHVVALAKRVLEGDG